VRKHGPARRSRPLIQLQGLFTGWGRSVSFLELFLGVLWSTNDQVFNAVGVEGGQQVLEVLVHRGSCFQRVSGGGEFGNRVHPFMHRAALPVPIFVAFISLWLAYFADDLVHEIAFLARPALPFNRACRPRLPLFRLPVERRESIPAHRLGERPSRQLSFIPLNFTAGLCAADKLSAFG